MFVVLLHILLTMGRVCEGEDYGTVGVSYQPCKLKLFKESEDLVSDLI